jgi:hypothetical protein
LQPQPPIPQQGPEGTLPPFADAAGELFFAGALKTESCKECRSLEHFGQEIFAPLESTIRSYRAPQSSHRYSYMGMSGIQLLVPADIVGRDRVPGKPGELALYLAAKKTTAPKKRGL